MAYTKRSVVKTPLRVSGEDFLCSDRQPSKEYVEKLVSGAKQHGLPEAYITQIVRIARQGEQPEEGAS